MAFFLVIISSMVRGPSSFLNRRDLNEDIPQQVQETFE